jgi:hypothetical protein
MPATTAIDDRGARVAARPATIATDAVEQAFRLLHVGFIVAPIIAGADKFFNLLVNWHQYVPGVVAGIIEPATLMPIVGVIEIAAGLLVAMKPRIGGMVVAAWLLAIIVSLLMIPGYFDVALRDLGLALGALALSRLAAARETRTA